MQFIVHLNNRNSLQKPTQKPTPACVQIMLTPRNCVIVQAGPLTQLTTVYHPFLLLKPRSQWLKFPPHSAQRTLLINSRSISAPHSLWFLGYTLEQGTKSVYIFKRVSIGGVSHFNSISVRHKKTRTIRYLDWYL